MPQRRHGSPARVVDPVLAAAPQVAGRRLLGVVAVGAQQAVGRRDHGVEIGYLADRRPRVEALEEQDLGLVHVADPGQQALVEQRLADGALRVAAQVRHRLLRVPVGPEDVRAEVADELVLPGAGDEAQVVHAVAGGGPLGVADAARGSCGRGAGRGRLPPVRDRYQEPSMRRWLCSVRSSSKRVRMCLPRATTSSTVRPRRSAVASAGTRRSKRVTSRPASA